MTNKIENRNRAKSILRPAGIRSCEYKAWFKTYSQAQQEIVRIRLWYIKNGVNPGKYRRPQRAYYCDFCFGYHLTSQAANAKKKAFH